MLLDTGIHYQRSLLKWLSIAENPDWRAVSIARLTALLLTSLHARTPTSVQYVKGIGPGWPRCWGPKGIHTVDDLLHYLPFRYEDRLNPRGISELRAGRWPQ